MSNFEQIPYQNYQLKTISSIWDFDVDGGAQGLITMKDQLGAIPAGSIVMRGIIEVMTGLVDSGSGWEGYLYIGSQVLNVYAFSLTGMDQYDTVGYIKSLGDFKLPGAYPEAVFIKFEIKNSDLAAGKLRFIFEYIEPAYSPQYKEIEK